MQSKKKTSKYIRAEISSDSSVGIYICAGACARRSARDAKSVLSIVVFSLSLSLLFRRSLRHPLAKFTMLRKSRCIDLGHFLVARENRFSKIDGGLKISSITLSTKIIRVYD